MGFLDILLYPIYVVAFYYLFSLRRKRYNDPILEHYHKIGFWIKALAVIPFTIFNLYISYGDSHGLYFTEGVNIHNLILKDSENLNWLFLPGKEFDQSLLFKSTNQGYFRSENNYMVAKFVAVFSFFSFSKYLILNLFFSLLSFSGIWRLYRFFYTLYPHLHKQMAIAILYLPTVIFWSSGILKDSICIGALGWLTYSLYEFLYKKKNVLINVGIVLIASYILSVLKVYILISYLPFFFLFLFLKNITLVKSRVVRVFIVLTLITFSLLLFTQVMSKLSESLGDYAGSGGDLSKGIEKHQLAYRETSSSFSLGVEFDGSVSSLAKMAPAAIIATLYRPFLWESRNVSTLLSSFESLFIMFFTLLVLFKLGFKHFFRTIFKDPVVIYCLLFSLLFALFVGATTKNFGSLVRYKIPCMPFYLIALYIIYDKGLKIKNSLVSKAV